MNLRAVLAIARKDLRASLRERMVVMPMVVVPLVLLVLMPGIAFVTSRAPVENGPDELLNATPPAIRQELAAYPAQAQMPAYMLLYLFAPLFLVLPLVVVQALAADSIAGERERRTLEALVYTPTTDAELLAGKLLGAFVPSVAVAWGGFVIYAIAANAALWHLLHRVFFPNGAWLLLVLWVAPAVSLLGLGVMTLVSARAKTVQGAYQAGGLLVLPFVMLMVGQLSGAFVLGAPALVALGALLYAADALLLAVGRRALRRDRLLSRL